MTTVELSSRSDAVAPARGPAVRPLALGVLAVGVFGWWALAEGGAAPTTWYPGALLFLVAAVALVRPRDVLGLPPPARWALAAFALFTAWSLLSISWAQAPGDAWDGSNRTLLYLTIFAVFALVPWRPAEAAALLGALVLVAVGVGAWALIAAIAGDRDAVVEGRLAAPVGYENASAALMLTALWPGVVLATQRRAPALVRGLMLAAAGVLLQLAILTQSRGSLIAAGVALLLAVWLTRERARLLVALIAVGGVAAAALPLLLAVYGTGLDDPHVELVRAGVAVAASATVLFATGVAWSRLDDRHAPNRHTLASWRWRAVAVLAALAAVAAAALLVRSGTSADAGTAGIPTRFTPSAPGLDNGRVDLWRVAAEQFADHPLRGAGADNFAHDYARERSHHEELMYPHSVEWRTLGQTGAVGGLLFAGFLAGVFVTAWRLRLDAQRGPLAVAALVAAAYWLAHASLDWLWELPAVTAPAMACLGLVAGLAPRTAAEGVDARPWSRIATAAAVVLAGLAAVSYALPGLAAVEVERAGRLAADDPAAARDALDRARRLNPLSDRPDVVAGTFALQEGDRDAARRAFARAVARDAHSWHSQTQLALLELDDGQRAAGLARLQRAHRLNPLESSISAALAAARAGTPVPSDVDVRLARSAVPGPLGRRPVSCHPILGLAAACTREGH